MKIDDIKLGSIVHVDTKVVEDGFASEATGGGDNMMVFFYIGTERKGEPPINSDTQLKGLGYVPAREKVLLENSKNRRNIKADQIEISVHPKREEQTMNYNKLATEIYEQNKAVGWWDDPDRCIFQTLQLVSTELAEATEGERRDRMDDKLPHRKMGEVELADALIRVLDLGGAYGWRHFCTDIGCMLSTIDTVAGRHGALNSALSDLFETCWRQKHLKADNVSTVSGRYSILINSIVWVACKQNYNIMDAVREKLEFNKTRTDHTREERAKPGGKAF